MEHDELSQDADGDMSLDWRIDDAMLSISISPAGRVALAWARGHRHGSCSAEFPAEAHAILLDVLNQDEERDSRPDGVEARRAERRRYFGEMNARVANNAAILEKLEAEKTKLLSDAPSRLPKVRKTPVQANRRASVSIS